MAYDVVIRNGTVVDGTGLPGYRADVGIRDGRIATIGRIRERGTEEIDAEGHAVSPGFIDGHTHMDAQVFWDELGSCSCWHGVTTAIMGHCGFTLAPAPATAKELVVRNLERAEDISGAAMAAGIDWSWTTFAEYLDAVDRQPKGINYISNVGHSALRTYVMGERAFTDEASADEEAAMAAELRDALRAGAWGFTTSRTMNHETSDDRPVASRLATWDEVRRLVGVMGELGVGVFQFVEDPPEPEERAAREERMIALTVETGVPIAIGATSGGRALEIIDRAAKAGGRIFGLTHPRGIGNMSSFRTKLPFDTLAEWRPVRALPIEEQRRLLADPEVRKKLIWAGHHGEYGRAIGAEARKPDFDRMRVVLDAVAPNPTVAELAAQRGVDPVELMIDLALETDLRQFFVQTISRFDPDVVKNAMKHQRTVPTFSDAGAHVSQMADYSIHTYLLAHWVRERGDFTLEEAVRLLTLAPAREWGIHDRGLLREGLVADVNVFDPARIGPVMPTLQFDLPGGEKRIVQKADGILATLVGGEVTQRSGEATGARPGRLIRGRLARG
ncbi:MAG TPA: amidohydrolase family protein [Acidimicrobiales bacterium]|nr:amidohydrolase family protein [Acidimicrobiales bacterium]